MNISICITVLNEEGSVGKLIESLLSQTKKANELFIVDGGSTDKTVQIIRHYQKKDRRIKLLEEKCTRARGRNLSVELSNGDIIVMTDADCVAKPDWLENITEPFTEQLIDIVAGFYEMTYKNELEKAERVFLGVLPKDFGINFLPSTRSIAFRKKTWEEIGGFPETKGNSAEDTDFNTKAVKMGVKYARVKNAVVEWGMPTSIPKFYKKNFNYALWDAKYGTWLNSTNLLTSHNIHSVLILLRYLIAFFLLIFGLSVPYLRLVLLALLILYVFWAYRKAGLWGIVLQFVSDFAVIKGLIYGIF